MMRKTSSFLLFVILVSGVLFFINRPSTLNAQIPNYTPSPAEVEKATNDYLAKICSGHGGINCSVINSDASIVCNDGTIDSSLPSIYFVPQCQEGISKLTENQSDFMAETGCFPPSELRCINSTHYQNLFNNLGNRSLSNSELGKEELAQCFNQIGEYEKDTRNYKQCLINNGRPDFEPSGKIILPLLKTMFCPLFYGEASYDSDLDLCLCDSGYFLQNDQCVLADEICQSRYGTKTYAKNGNCTALSSTPVFSKSFPSPTAQPIKTSSPIQTIMTKPIADSTPDYQPVEFTPSTMPPIIENQEIKKSNFISNLLSSLMAGIKNVLKLF